MQELTIANVHADVAWALRAWTEEHQVASLHLL